jgi:hypothetical protein
MVWACYDETPCDYVPFQLLQYFELISDGIFIREAILHNSMRCSWSKHSAASLKPARVERPGYPTSKQSPRDFDDFFASDANIDTEHLREELDEAKASDQAVKIGCRSDLIRPGMSANMFRANSGNPLWFAKMTT